MSWIAIGVTSVGVSMYGTVSSANAANAAASASQASEEGKYAIQQSIAESMIQDEQTNAMLAMTEVERKFLQAKGAMATQQAETMVGGNTAKRLQLNQRAKASEAKSDIARDTDTNVVNIANDMLAKRVDTMANLARYESQKVSTANIAISALGSGLTAAATVGSFANSTTGIKFENWLKG